MQPFINKYCRDTKYIFWPKLATSHYANSVTKWLKIQKIPFVQKKDNPANLPEARAIGKFWAMLSVMCTRMDGLQIIYQTLSVGFVIVPVDLI